MRYYYIHSPADWESQQIEEINSELTKLGYAQDKQAAIGEGAGGAGFETVVEFLLSDPIATGILSAMLYDLAKALWRHRPKRKILPEGLPERLDSYRLVVHVENENQNTIVSIDLKSEPKDIEIAVKTKLPDRLDRNPSRLFQNGDDWDEY